MSVNISWKANDSADDVVSYHVERSIVGVRTSSVAPFNIAIGSTIQLRVDGGNLVTVTFNAITNGAATANQVKTILDGTLAPYGGSAKITAAGNRVIIQSNRQTDRGSINIKAGSALAGLGILAGVRKFQTEEFEVAEVTHPTASYEDLDGEEGYQYRISAENSDGDYSEPTEWFTGFRETIPTSVVYGNLIAADGKPLADARIEYGPPINKRPSDDNLQGWAPNSDARVGVGLQAKETLTDQNGYFQMVVPANAPMRLKVDSIGHDFVYKTPSQGSQQDFTDLEEASSYESMALNSDWNNV